METDWCDWLAEGLIENGCQYLSVALLEGAERVQEGVRKAADRLNFPLQSDQTISEKIGYEVALTYSYGKKRSAFLTHGFSLPVAMDPLMSSIYTGVAGGFVIIALDGTPPLPYSSGCDPVSLAMFAKMPVLELAAFGEIPLGIRQAFTLSEKYGTPVMLHLDTKIPLGDSPGQGKAGRRRKTEFEKNPARWAATPRFRFLLHKQLNQRLKDIAGSNPKDLVRLTEGKTPKLGIICTHANAALVEPWARRHDVSVLSVRMPFPLPLDPVSRFVETHASVIVIEDRFPTIQFQLPQREKVKGRWTDPALDRVFSWDGETLAKALDAWKAGKNLDLASAPSPDDPEPEGTLTKLGDLLAGFKAKTQSFTLVADKTPLTAGLPVDHFVSRGGAISVAAGFHHAGESDAPPVLGITDSSAFLHYGIQATTNAIYNTSRVKCLLLVRPEHASLLKGFLNAMEQVDTIPFNPGAKTATKKLKVPATQAVTFYTIPMEEAV